MRRPLALAVLLAALLVAPASAQQEAAQGEASEVRANEPTASGEAVVARGHVDIGPRFVDGAFRMQVRDDSVSPSVWRELDDVVLQARDAARVTVPDEPRFAFLGRPGSRVWLLPQVQDQAILWPGWNSQDPEVARRVRRELTWTLHGVQGPGRFALFSSDGFGEPTVLFDSAKQGSQEVGIDADTHVHGNWAFSRPGSYLLDVEMGAELDDGETVSDRRPLRLFVGDADARAALRAQLPGAGSDDGSNLPWAAALIALCVLGLLAGAVVRRRRRPA